MLFRAKPQVLVGGRTAGPDIGPRGLGAGPEPRHRHVQIPIRLNYSSEPKGFLNYLCSQIVTATRKIDVADTCGCVLARTLESRAGTWALSSRALGVQLHLQSSSSAWKMEDCRYRHFHNTVIKSGGHGIFWRWMKKVAFLISFF